MILKCKICGGDIEVIEDKALGLCEYCGCTITFPKLDDEQRVSMFNRGNQYRQMGEFDRAMSVYEQIIKENNTDAEAHWCCALSRFGIEYVEDPVTFEWIPTCHRLSFDSFADDIDYLAALEYSEGLLKKRYMKDAAKIVEVQKGILSTSQSEEPFDIFICYKESSENGERTVDSVLAQDIYYQLTDKGYRVFYAKITLESKVGTEYEPYIFAALNSAKVMIVVGTNKDYLNAVWVKNEWSRYLAIMRRNRDRILIPCYKDMDPYDMPEALSILQSYDMSKIGFIQDLLRGIDKIIDNKEKEEINKGYAVETVLQTASTEPLLKRILLFLEDGDFEKADEYCENVLNIDPENSRAYLYKVMVTEKLRNEQDFSKVGIKIQKDKNYIKAKRFANDEESELLDKVIEVAAIADYSQACEAMESTEDLEKLKQAYLLFGEIIEYKDSEEKRNIIERDIVLPLYKDYIDRYEKESSYFEKNKLKYAFELISFWIPDAEKYVKDLENYKTDEKCQLEVLLCTADQYKNAMELIGKIKKDYPHFFEDEIHEGFAKKLEEVLLIEKWYGNTKTDALQIIEKYYESF